MTNQLWRLWNVVNGKETPLTTPVPFAEARMTMRLKAIGDFSRRLGWKLLSQGNDFMIWRMPGGADNELRIRMETPEVNNYEAIAGIDYPLDKDLEWLELRDPWDANQSDPVVWSPEEWAEADTQPDLQAIDDETIYGYREGDAGVEDEVQVAQNGN